MNQNQVKVESSENFTQMGVSKNKGYPQIIHLIRFSIINHPFWGTTIFGNTQMVKSW